MQKIIKKRIGKEEHTFIIEADSFHDIVMKAKKFSFGNVDKCGLCKSDAIYLSAHEAGKKKHKYTTIRCGNCKACLNFGQQQEDPEIVYLKTREVEENGKKIRILDWQSAEQQKFEEDKKDQE